MNDVSLNLVVIRSTDIERACRFYTASGLAFTKHAHGTGPEHYACEVGGVVFEIYPRMSKEDSTSATRLGFRVMSVDDAVAGLQQLGAKVVSPPKESPWGRRAVIDDPDGHRVELTEPT